MRPEKGQEKHIFKIYVIKVTKRIFKVKGCFSSFS